MDWSKLRRQETQRLRDVEYSFVDMSGFSDRPTWTKPGHKYMRTECQVCGARIGTCRGEGRFMELKLAHRLDCPIPCGFNDCFDCNTERTVT